MDSNYHFEEEIQQIDFTLNHFETGDYESCKFENRNFNEIDLSE